IITLFRAQPEHAICQSYPTGTAKNYRNSGDSKCPAKVRMTIDEDSRNRKTDPQPHAQGTIRLPYIQKRRHVGSGIRRFIQKFPKEAANYTNFEFTPLWTKQSAVRLPNHVTFTAMRAT